MLKELTGIKINSLVDVMHYYQPETLTRLKGQFGFNEANRQLLTPGITLGEETLTGAQLYLEVAEKGLKASRLRVQPNTARLRERLRNAKRLRMISQIVAAITSAGLITVLFSGWAETTKITIAFINFAAVVCNIFSNYLETPLHGGAGSLINIYETLVRVDVESELLLQELELFKKVAVSDEKIMGKVASANSLAAELLKTEKYLWG